MKFSNLIWVVSTICLVHALPKPNPIKKRDSGFYWLGCNESGAEWAPTVLPGTNGTNYFWPNTSSIRVLKDAGMNIFRVPFSMERLIPGSMTGSFDMGYLSDLRSTVTFITAQLGAFALIDPHNYGRYNGNIITSTSDFKTFWFNVASQFSFFDKVIFDTNNEYHDMDQTLVFNLNQAAIDGIRTAGAVTQYIFAEGNSWSGASTWASVNDNLKNLIDPSEKIVYEMHLYLDSDGSGTSSTCVSPTIGQERAQSATQWLESNHKKGFIGEFAGGVNDVCRTAVDGLLSYLSSKDVWLGATWWAGGPKWGNYIFSIEPTDGIANSCYLPILEKYYVSTSTIPSYSTGTISTPSYPANTASYPTESPNTNTQYPVPPPSTATSSPTVPSTSIPAIAYSSPPSTTTSTPAGTTSTIPSSSMPTIAYSSGYTPGKVYFGSPPSTTISSPAGTTPTTSAVSSPALIYPTEKLPASGYPRSSCTTPLPVETQLQHYDQCGGTNWTGPTRCVSAYTCTSQNPYYWQCM